MEISGALCNGLISTEFLKWIFHTENQGDHLHALRGHPGRRAEARTSGPRGQRNARHHDHHEGCLLQQMPECSAAGHGQISKSWKHGTDWQHTKPWFTGKWLTSDSALVRGDPSSSVARTTLRWLRLPTRPLSCHRLWTACRASSVLSPYSSCPSTWLSYEDMM